MLARMLDGDARASARPSSRVRRAASMSPPAVLGGAAKKRAEAEEPALPILDARQRDGLDEQGNGGRRDAFVDRRRAEAAERVGASSSGRRERAPGSGSRWPARTCRRSRSTHEASDELAAARSARACTAPGPCGRTLSGAGAPGQTVPLDGGRRACASRRWPRTNQNQLHGPVRPNRSAPGLGVLLLVRRRPGRKSKAARRLSFSSSRRSTKPSIADVAAEDVPVPASSPRKAGRSESRWRARASLHLPALGQALRRVLAHGLEQAVAAGAGEEDDERLVDQVGQGIEHVAAKGDGLGGLPGCSRRRRRRGGAAGPAPRR